MKRLFVYCSMMYSLFTMASDDIHIAVQAQEHERMPILFGIVGSVSDDFKQVIATCKKDFQLTGQCVVQVQNFDVIQKKSQLKKMFDEGLYIAIFLTEKSGTIDWRVYDTQQAKMIAGKRYEKKGDVVRGWGHDLADAIWPTCMGSQSSFSSKIAYCVQKWVTVGTREKVQKHIYIADSDGSYAQPLVTLPTVCLAPRWNKDPHAPILFYSENTVSNVRLAMTNMFKKRQIICSFDGLNMLPAFSPNGKHIVFCLSKDGSSQLYHTFVRHGKRVYERLTDNEGQNISPCFTDNNHVMFVSDYKTLRPQIYQMNITTKEIIRITDGGYCACPDYCRANNKLLYSKMIDGAMQIFIYDFDEQVHTQLTKGSESKEEGCWSACGNFIMFAAKQGLNSRIARFNLITGKMQYITSASQNCSYPAWSPVYDSFIS